MQVTDPEDAARDFWINQGSADAADGLSAVLGLMSAHRLVMARIDRTIGPLGLTFAKYEILMMLTFTSRGSMSIGRMGLLLQVHPTSVTSTVDGLEALGLVVRRRSSSDRRMVHAHITMKGRRLAERATAALNAEVFEQLGLTSSQSARLWSVLRSLRANAGDFIEPRRRTGPRGSRAV